MNCRALLFCSLLLMAFSDLAGAGTDCFKPEDSKHPIDVWEEKEMKKTEGVTVSITNVQNQAYTKWDKELNRLYQELMSKLPEEKETLLRESQRNRLKFRDAEYDLLNRATVQRAAPCRRLLWATSVKT